MTEGNKNRRITNAAFGMGTATLANSDYLDITSSSTHRRWFIAANNNKTDTQSPVPRPFYCTMYRREQPEGVFAAGTDHVSDHDWEFYTIPDQVTVSNITPPPLDQLYVDEDWQ